MKIQIPLQIRTLIIQSQLSVEMLQRSINFFNNFNNFLNMKQIQNLILIIIINLIVQIEYFW